MVFAELCTVVMSIASTAHTILQHLHAARTTRSVGNGKISWRADCCSTVRTNLRWLMVLTEQLRMVEHHFWAQEQSTDFWDHILMQA